MHALHGATKGEVMKLYHFTSKENLWKIIEAGYIDTISTEMGENIIWLTKDEEKHHQLWAMGSDKTDIRITVSTIEIARFLPPEEPEKRHELFKIGAFNILGGANWYLGSKPLGMSKIEVFQKERGRYIECREAYELLAKLYPPDESWKKNSYWYKVRWSKQEEATEDAKK